MDALPEPVLRSVMERLGAADRLVCASVCRGFRAAGPPPPRGSVGAAGFASSADAMEWYLRNCDFTDRAAARRAARSAVGACRDEAVLDALSACPALMAALDETVPRAAAAADNIEALRWLRVRGCPWDERTALAAAGATPEGTRGLVFRWVAANGCPYKPRRALRAATRAVVYGSSPP